MDDTLTEAIREAYASPRSSEVIFETIEIAHALLTEPVYLVNDKIELVATLETSDEVTFRPVGFELKRPDSNDAGLSELTLTIDNTNREAGEIAIQLAESTDPPQVKYRVYVASDLGTPANDPPVTLFLRDVEIGTFQVKARAVFMDLVNHPFLHVLYRRRTFPSLGY